MLTPGDQYIGGRDFFITHPNLVRNQYPLPDPGEKQAAQRPTRNADGCHEAFFIGVAAGFILENGKGNRSMMVHPSRETMRHGQYVRWVRDIKTLWQQTIELPEGDPDRQDLIDEFAVAHADLAATVPNRPPLQDLIRSSPEQSDVSGDRDQRGKRSDPRDRLGQHLRAHLVGGQAMDRGFTVEGLTITYMPRGTGLGNADTVRQRARFSGITAYLGYCRIFLENAARVAYGRYVEHEEDIRGRMIAHRDEGRHLGNWRAHFFLSARCSRRGTTCSTWTIARRLLRRLVHAEVAPRLGRGRGREPPGRPELPRHLADGPR